MTICIDASVVVKLLVLEPDTSGVRAWFAANPDVALLAPAHMPAEVTTALRRKIVRGWLSEGEAISALRLLNRLGVDERSTQPLLQRAVGLASELEQPTVYDALYLALAEQEHCALLTADRTFERACAAKFPFVHAI